VTLTLAGSPAESVYRDHNEESDIGLQLAKIPFNTNTVGHTGEFREKRRQKPPSPS